MNAIVGILVILSAWLIVDFVMKVLYEPNTAFSGRVFGPWNRILADNGGNYCIQETTPTAISVGSIISGITIAQPGTYAIGTGTGSCSPQDVAAAAAAGGYQLSPAQANALACIAKPESACGTNRSVATTPSGKQTSAAGPWQILIGASDKCHSLNIPACGNLNCSAAFSGGRPKSDSASQQLYNQCRAEANNLTCAAAASACLIQAKNGSFSDWTADSRSAAQRSCITSNGLTY